MYYCLCACNLCVRTYLLFEVTQLLVYQPSFLLTGVNYCSSTCVFLSHTRVLRYLHWVEQTYPSLSHSPDLENLLFRCVRDAAHLPQVQNDEDFVNMWIRLANSRRQITVVNEACSCPTKVPTTKTEYCERPTELFEMLFRQGVGTMCVKFYVAWADLLKSQHLLAPAAAVYAHGLRAGAQPLALLEDHAE
ncbi:Mitotic checkpoint serine/threonine-protein kinase BUB1 beta [Paragonimus heterotremus]|uniref:Mitotic checkpoint serine/threonine-protein kinase BUB1 beta n=1 Tax=Paragonimus heterotremus TaxID=100268 RepID=A0A8J4WRQ7_9TREM|nr:Mitotic checkpoint serine/threonine-protein kinase BUB1 beta [Paragonimus heterotremus]